MRHVSLLNIILMSSIPALCVVILRLSVAAACCCGLLGCAHQRLATPPDRSIAPKKPAPTNVFLSLVERNTGDKVAQFAQDLVGVRYRYGGISPRDGFDCSGLVQYVYAHAVHIDLPRTARQLASIPAQSVRRSELSPGDLIFFSRNKRVTHIGIYIGEQRFVHAPNRHEAVRISHLDESYWADHYSGAKRPLTLYD